MTREEAIRHIRDVIAENNSIKPNIVTFEQEKEALYMAIEALQRQTDGDLISRADLPIKYLTLSSRETDKDGNVIQSRSTTWEVVMKTDIEDLPSADAVHKPDYSYEADMVRRLKEATQK